MPQHSAASLSNDEIDLFALIKALWLRKWTVIVIAALVTIGAVIYAVTAKRLYEAKVYMLPPTQNDIANFNFGRKLSTELPPFTVKDVYDVFARNLTSESLRLKFFNEVYLPSLAEESRSGSRDRLYQALSKQLIIAPGGKDNAERYSVAVQSYNPAEAGEWVRTYVRYASSEAKAEMIKNVVREAQVRARSADQEIAALRESTRRKREDQIKVLSEALAIAKAVGLKKPVIISGKTPADLSLGVDSESIYMRGSDALQAEIDSLQGRDSDDPFIQDLRALQVRSSILKNFTIDPSSVAVYRQDGDIKDPDSPIKPDKISIVFKGIAIGIFLGLLVALTSYFLPLIRLKFDHVGR